MNDDYGQVNFPLNNHVDLDGRAGEKETEGDVGGAFRGDVMWRGQRVYA